MNNFLKSNWVIVLIVVFILISLFLPFNWYLSNSLNEPQQHYYLREIGKQLPMRNYEFLFSPSDKIVIFDKWGWDYDKSVKRIVEVPLHRVLVVFELILNYVLSFLIIVLFYLLNERRKLKKQ
jgi:ABC-type glycerol-3-phosphate transport system permease component